MRNIVIIFLTFVLVTGCAKKKKVSPETVETHKASTPTIEVKTEPVQDISSSTPIEVEEALTENEDVEITEIDAVATDLAKNEIISVDEVLEENAEIQEKMVSKQDSDYVFPDSIWVDYMIKPGDYLSLIAYQEYGNANEWRRIWKWNQEHWEENGIGPDADNPNLIYPYNELDLKKPTAHAVEWEYEHYFYSVKMHDTLWTIAKEVYGDELAWVVLFWDNDALINENDGKLFPDMELKVRTQLWPEFD
jgi:nucleoid-associated protein YgaU